MITSLDDLQKHMSKCKHHDDQGHWLSLDEIDYLADNGFVYAIHCKHNGMMYIGKKTFKRAGKKTKMLDGKTVKNKAFGKDSGWRNYCSSSDNIKADIARLGHDLFDFYHIHNCKTKGCLTYSECNLLHLLHALTCRFEDGSRVFYNNQIGAIKYVPVTCQKSNSHVSINKQGFTYAV